MELVGADSVVELKLFLILKDLPLTGMTWTTSVRSPLPHPLHYLHGCSQTLLYGNSSNLSSSVSLYRPSWLVPISNGRLGGPHHAIEFLQKSHGVPETHTTIPVVFLDGKYVGGYTSLVEHLQKEGKKNPSR